MEKELNIINKAIVNTLKPLKIYLFGSHAKGNYNKNSDYDLCIITNDKSKRKIDMAIDAEMSLINLTNKGTDIIVLYEDEFLERSKHLGTLEYSILKEGKVIYEQ